MSRKEIIIEIADSMMRERGYNAFSFHDIAHKIGIKSSSIHYHFPTKKDLAVAVVAMHIKNLENTIKQVENQKASTKLNAFYEIYEKLHLDNKVCIVGTLATDWNSIEDEIKQELNLFSDKMLDWVKSFLEQGKKEAEFHFSSSSETKALMLIGNFLAFLQLSRLSNKISFQTFKENFTKELQEI